MFSRLTCHRPAGCIAAAVSLLFLGGPAASQSVAPSASDWAALPAPLLPMRLPVAASERWELRASAVDFEANDATAVRGLSGDWARFKPRKGTNVTLQSAQADLTASRDRWEIATVVRGEALIAGPRSTWEAVHVYKQKQTPEDGARYALDAHQDGVILAGVRGAHTWAIPLESDERPLQLTAALSWLSVRRLQRVDVDGAVQYSAASGYGFEAQGQRQDSGRQYGGYGNLGTTGRGYAVDLGLLWQPTASTFVNLSAMDLLSRLSVPHVGTQQATLSSATTSIDSAGYLNYQPLVSGRYSSQDLDRRLTRKWSLTAGMRLSDSDDALRVGARWERFGTVDMPALWAVLPIVQGWSLPVDGDMRFRSIGVGLRSHSLTLMVRTRSLPVGQSQSLGWQASFNLPI